MNNNPVSVYHYLRKLSPAKAREFVLNKLAEYDGNISKTARALNISRNTVRRAKAYPLEDLSRAPKSIKDKDSRLVGGYDPPDFRVVNISASSAFSSYFKKANRLVFVFIY